MTQFIALLNYYTIIRDIRRIRASCLNVSWLPSVIVQLRQPYRGTPNKMEFTKTALILFLASLIVSIADGFGLFGLTNKRTTTPVPRYTPEPSHHLDHGHWSTTPPSEVTQQPLVHTSSTTEDDTMVVDSALEGASSPADDGSTTTLDPNFRQMIRAPKKKCPPGERSVGGVCRASVR